MIKPHLEQSLQEEQIRSLGARYEDVVTIHHFEYLDSPRSV
jgi:hypothetical protein